MQTIEFSIYDGQVSTGFSVPSDQRIAEIRKNYAERVGVPSNCIVLQYYRKIVYDDDTPESLALCHYDTIIATLAE